MFVGCVQKHEQSNRRCHQGIIFGNRGFSSEERGIYDITGSKDMEDLENDRKNPKITVDD